MRTDLSVTAPLGDLVLAVYDRAADYSTDPREVTHLATATLDHMLRHARQTSGILTMGPSRTFGMRAEDCEI